MTVTEANRYINALNRIAEGVTMLASAIEEASWASFEDHAGMPGARPIAAAQLAQPQVEKAERPWEEEPQPSNAPVVPVSLEQVRAVLADLTGRGMTAQVKALITQTGAEKLSAVEPGKYGWLLEQAEGITNA